MREHFLSFISAKICDIPLCFKRLYRTLTFAIWLLFYSFYRGFLDGGKNRIISSTVFLKQDSRLEWLQIADWIKIIILLWPQSVDSALNTVLWQDLYRNMLLFSHCCDCFIRPPHYRLQIYVAILISRDSPKEKFRNDLFTLRGKCPCSELFCSTFSRIRTEYGEIQSISLYSVQMLENTDQRNYEYGHFLCSLILVKLQNKPLWTCKNILVFQTDQENI